MLHHLKLGLLALAEDPLLLTLAFLFPSLALLWTVNRAGGWPRAVTYGRYLLGAIAVLMIVFYLAVCWTYLFSDAFLDHLVPRMASVAWLFWKGKPMYHDMTQPERYSTLYGPYAYIFIGFFQGVLGPSVFSTKLPSVIAGPSSLLLIFIVIRGRSTLLRALCLTALSAALLLSFECASISFLPRCDPFILLAVALGLFAATRHGILGPILLGLSIGTAVNLKIHAFIYFLPIFVLAWERKWNISAILAGLAAAVVAVILPFVVFPNVSLGNFLEILKMVAGPKLSIWFFLKNLEWFFMLVLPVTLFLIYERISTKVQSRRHFGEQRRYLIALVLTFFAVLFPASKVGAGPYHLIPFIPIMAFIGAGPSGLGSDFCGISNRATGFILAVAMAWVAACFFEGATGGWYRVCKGVMYWGDKSKHCIDDIKSIVRDHPHDVILAGAGSEDSYPVSYTRCELIFEGMPVGIDPAALMDYKVNNFPEPSLARLVGKLEKDYGEPVMWIIPRNSPPFTYESYLSPGHPLLSDKFRADFTKMFTRTASTQMFDIYTPVNAGGPLGGSK